MKMQTTAAFNNKSHHKLLIIFDGLYFTTLPSCMIKYFAACFLLFIAGISVAQVPVINSFSPVSGQAGSTVTINGTGFSATASNNKVYFGAARAAVTAATTTALTVTVPAGATFEPIRVKTDSLVGFSAFPFITTFSQGGGDPLPADAFGSPVDIAPMTKPAIADFDGDGRADIAGAITGNKIAVYINRSNADSISYQLRLTITGAFSNPVTGIMAADFSGDGKPELVAFASNSYQLFKNTSSNDTVSFATPTFLGSGGIYSMAAADIDGDGKIDLLSAFSSSSNAFSVQRNTSTGGNISFALPVRISFGSVPGGSGTIGADNLLIAMDVDGDRKPDVITKTRFWPPFLIYRNTSTPGTISFAANTPVISGGTGITGNGAFEMAMADIDGDNKPELAFTAQDSNFVAIYKNNSVVGNISYSAKMRFTTGYNPVGIAFNDMDGDSKTDLVVASYSNTLSILRNTSTTGTIAFDALRSYFSRSFAYANAFDVDGDAKTDILIATTPTLAPQYNAAVLKSYVFNPVITSVIPITASAGTPVTIRGNRFTGATSVSFGGVEAASFQVLSDTVIIAVVGNGASGNVSVGTPFGTGKFGGFTFSPPIPYIYSFSPMAGPVGTVVTIKGKNFSSSPGGNLVYFGSGKANVLAATDTTVTVLAPTGGSYQPISVYVSSTLLTAFSSFPFNTTFDSRITAFSNANFGDTVMYATPSHGQRIEAADFDEDLKPDLSASIYYDYSGVSVYKNSTGPTGKPLFLPAKNIDTYGAAPGGNATGGTNTAPVDIDGDGRLDMASMSNGANTVSIMRNISTADSISFAPKINFYAGLNPTSITCTDLDNDGKTDIAITNPYPSGRISILKNTSSPGNISFLPIIQFTAGSVPQQVLLEDFNNDGKKDMACTNYNVGNMSLFKNISTTGTIAFGTPVTKTTGAGPIRMAAADLNGDGLIDILVNNNTPKTISVFRNISTADTILFADKVDYAMPDYPIGITVADLDGDGKPDVLSGSNTFPLTLSVFKNISTIDTIMFAPRAAISKSSTPSWINTADVNADGKPDIILTNLNTDKITVIRNVIGDPLPVEVCPLADSFVLQSGITGSSYQWQVNTGSGFTDIADGVNYVGSDSVTLVIKNIPTSWYGYQYRCVADGGKSDTYQLKITARWLGAVNGAWENAANWACGHLPDRYTDVLINSGSVIVNSSVEIRSIRVSPAAGITIAENFEFKVLQ